MSAEPSVPFTGIGRAVPAMPTPVGRCATEAEDLARLAGDEQLAAALIRVIGRLVVCVPAIRLLDLFDRWATRVESLAKSREGAMLTLKHRISRGRHGELWLLTRERVG